MIDTGLMSVGSPPGAYLLVSHGFNFLNYVAVRTAARVEAVLWVCITARRSLPRFSACSEDVLF